MLNQAHNGIRSFPIRLQGGGGEEQLAVLGREGEQLVLVLAGKAARAAQDPPNAHLAALSVLVSDDPFPGLTMDGRQMIWVKSYSENAGILEQLEKARILRPSGTTIKQGLVSLPLAEVVLSESEIAQRCALEGCHEFESVETTQRFKRCSTCKRRYYCSVEHQQAHWSRHKKDCKDLAAGRLVQVENRRRAEEELPPPVEQRVVELAESDS